MANQVRQSIGDFVVEMKRLVFKEASYSTRADAWKEISEVDFDNSSLFDVLFRVRCDASPLKEAMYRIWRIVDCREGVGQGSLNEFELGCWSAYGAVLGSVTFGDAE